MSDYSPSKNDSLMNYSQKDSIKFFYLTKEKEIEIQEALKTIKNPEYQLISDENKEFRKLLKQKKKHPEKIHEKTKNISRTILLNKKNINKKMSINDKRNLTNNIKCLSEEQLKAIINLLKENEYVEKDGFYEFDVNFLSSERLKDLDKYVKSCMKTSKDNIPPKYVDEFNKKQKNKDERNKSINISELSENY